MSHDEALVPRQQTLASDAGRPARPDLRLATGACGVDLAAAERAAAEFLTALGMEFDGDGLRERRPGWPAPTPSSSTPSRSG